MPIRTGRDWLKEMNSSSGNYHVNPTGRRLLSQWGIWGDKTQNIMDSVIKQSFRQAEIKPKIIHMTDPLNEKEQRHILSLLTRK